MVCSTSNARWIDFREKRLDSVARGRAPREGSRTDCERAPRRRLGGQVPDRFEAAHGAAKSHASRRDPTSGPERPRDFRASNGGQIAVAHPGCALRDLRQGEIRRRVGRPRAVTARSVRVYRCGLALDAGDRPHPDVIEALREN